MSTIRPFKGIRPAENLAASIAALPYDVYSSDEARKVVKANPLSFLKIDRAETLLPEGTDIYSPEVYKTARRTLDAMIENRAFIQDPSACYYIYRYGAANSSFAPIRLLSDLRTSDIC